MTYEKEAGVLERGVTLFGFEGAGKGKLEGFPFQTSEAFEMGRRKKNGALRTLAKAKVSGAKFLLTRMHL